VRSGRPIRAFLALSATAALALAAPSALTAQEPDPAGTPPVDAVVAAPNAAPAALFTASPNPLPAGGLVEFDASHSSDADGSIVSYRWDLDGDGSFEADTGSVPRAFATYPLPGTVRVRLRVTDDRGAEGEAFLDVTAHPLPEAQPAAAAPPEPQPAPAEPAAPPPKPRAAKRVAATPVADKRPPSASPRISAAASTSVTISDFKFTPAKITVNVGDTVTWSNRGPTAHSATARDGSFDTGILGRGRSASHRFTKAGTFAYICTPHPFMHGTVTVTGASAGGSGSGGAGAAGSSGGSGSTESAGSSGGSLPHTGLAIASLVLTGAGLVAAGATIRLALARRSAAL
jgi:plastocyanin